MATFIVLLGPPGVGKGTQAKILSERTGLAHISSGDLFRENLKNQTELGKLAQTYMGRGELVPDDVTIAMIRERLNRPDCKAGAILDGFPRTPAQADALEAMLEEFRGHVDAVPFITGAEDVLVDRLSGRWTCRASGHIFNEKYNPPAESGRCDFDGSELYQRDDDKAETVKRRIQVYLEQTSPLITYYRDHGKLVEVDGMQTIEQVTEDLISALKK
ncbi:MAG: adenylate kinase [Anaerolineales bacterium]|nr:adenylate kinase [Anaerolineae bacterium]PWB75923.1 MAG: adenylate kinase [Anaerolineales bacterium]